MTHTTLPSHTTQRVHTITAIAARVRSSLQTGHATPAVLRRSQADLERLVDEANRAISELRAVKAREVV